MIKLIAVGKIKEQYMQEGIKDYQTRLKRYVKLELIEVKDSDPQNEAEEILKYLKEKDYVIRLDIDGISLDSVSLSKKISGLYNQSISDIVFIIGGSDGISQSIRYNEKISFSRLTFPHQLFRLVFLEQLYRAFKIMNNESYHK